MQIDADSAVKRAKLDSSGGLSYTSARNTSRSYVKRRVYKQQEFLHSVYESGSRRSSRLHFRLGNEYLDTQNSFITFDLVANIAGESFTDYNFGVDTHPISLIKSITVYDRLGKVLYQLDHVNKCMLYKWASKKDQHFLHETLGWGKHIFVLTPSVQKRAQSNPMQCVIPLAMLGGMFDCNNLLPPQLLADLMIDIEWETAEKALTLYPKDSQPRASDNWLQTTTEPLTNTDFFNLYGRDLVNYTISNLHVMADCYEIDPATHALMTQKFNTEGIQIQFEMYTTQFTDVLNRNKIPNFSLFAVPDPLKDYLEGSPTQSSDNVPITQSFSKATNVSFFSWAEFVTNYDRLLDPGYIYDAQDALTKPVWFSSELAQLCTSYHSNLDNIIRSYRWRVHNYYMPHFAMPVSTSVYSDDNVDADRENNNRVLDFMEAVAHNVNRTEVATTQKLYNTYNGRWKKPLSTRLAKTFSGQRVGPIPADVIEEDTLQIDFEHPVVLEIQTNASYVEKNSVYGGFMTYLPTQTDLIDELDATEKDYYSAWGDIFGVSNKAMLVITHSVTMQITPSETIVTR